MLETTVNVLLTLESCKSSYLVSGGCEAYVVLCCMKDSSYVGGRSSATKSSTLNRRETICFIHNLNRLQRQMHLVVHLCFQSALSWRKHVTSKLHRKQPVLKCRPRLQLVTCPVSKVHRLNDHQWLHASRMSISATYEAPMF
jgi:hypothetical protein